MTANAPPPDAVVVCRSLRAALALLDEDAGAGRCAAREHGSRERGGQPVAERDRQRPDAGAAEADRRSVGHVEREGVALRAEVGDAARVAERGLCELEGGQTAAWRRQGGRDGLARRTAHVQAAVVERAAHACRDGP